MENEFNLNNIEKKIPVLKQTMKKIKPVLNYIEKNTSKIFIILLITLLVLFALNIFSTSAANLTLSGKVALIKEANKPVKIELSIIDCEDCYDINIIIDSVKKQNVEILGEKNLDYNSAEAKELISKYNIQKLPSILISGEIDTEKVNFNDFKLINGALVLNKINAPFFDLITNEFKGKVIIKEIIDSSCKDCVSLTVVGTSFAEAGVLIFDWKKVEYNSAEGKELISKFNIKKIPTMLISDDIDYYEGMKEGLAILNVEEKQGFYVLHSTTPPYKDLTKNKIVGLVELIMLKDDSCIDCYNVNSNKQILTRLGLTISNEKTYDISSAEGKALISKYNIKKVPIIILSPEAGEYVSFVSAWEAVGTEESDGWFIMRKPESLGNIQEL